jgi:zinc transport system substrate-binding protein
VRRAVMCAACAFAVVAGVVAPPAAGAASKRPVKRTVVAAFYPIAYAAQQVGGARVSVTNLTPAGAEPHDLELSPAQMDRLLDADAVFVMGHGFQPAVEKAAQQRDGVTVDVLDTLPIGAGSKKVKAEGSSSGLDPHVWLDPVLMQDIVREVQRGLTKADPKGAAVYAKNADALVAELEALDAKFRAGLASCSRDLIVTSHEAFGYLAARYGLRQEGAAGIDPTAEPDAKRIAELTDLVKKNGVTVVFTESLVSPRVADTLAREAGVKTDTLDPLEGLSGKKQAAGDNYFTVMDTNLRKLRAALGCS